MNKHALLFATAALTSLAAPVSAQLALNIDQATGLVRVVNTSDTETVELNGYDLASLQSSAANDGLLNPAGWAPLETAVGDGWQATNSPSSELLLETNPNSVLSLGPGGSRSLGASFTTNASRIASAQTAAGFGNEYRDVSFRYTDALNNSAVEVGAVNYENARFNNLVLDVDFGTGAVTLTNESAIAVEIEAYIISSAAGSLDPSWNGLRDTVANWEQNVGTANALAEVSRLDTSSSPGAPLAPLTIAAGASYDLGSAYTVGGLRDLDFSFLLTSDTAGDGFAGEVRYVGLHGDYNGDGSVNAADYTVWRDTLDSTSDLRADGNGDGVIDQADYGVWTANYGASSGSSFAVATPEPTTMTSLAVGLALAGLGKRRS
ncbi:dockerin type I domain-containing protein [Botrimarina mediterranea]|uniref:PEP-CTERM protein-sorting domain-containing protein n=1 Tax=Botrimarina mediterranea TaxID=2528022 RepID=A0A518K2S2_9BACT|nr:dockerin type I domain-containing protein [Botrimarina mediterranea]QDV72108.1 hypothetical protein Spa11_02790 [Botrimarina mediterranea]QDV76650.1 hypothetical protein K2D_02300 [Planctomycetes bacterium K2D]